MMEAVEVRKATGADLKALIPAVARAFAPQPLTCWLLGRGADAWRRGQRLIELEFRKSLPYGLTYTTSDLRGAALWHPPNKKIELWNDLVWSLQNLAAIGVGRNSLSHLMTGMRLALQEPHQAHYYLAILGVDPEAQGQGAGSRLLAPVLAMCDTQRMPAYLVTDTPDARRFYERHGFQVRKQVPVYGAALTLWSMWRQPNP